MSDVFIGQLLAVGFNFAPRGWALAAGQLMPISQNTALFSLLGTFYGGDGRSTFALPNLQGNMAIGSGSGPTGNYDIGQTGGEPAVTLLISEIPLHTHTMQCFDGRSVTGQVSAPANAVLSATGGASPQNVYLPGAQANAQLSPQALSIAGASLPHNNMMPYLGINWIIAQQGVFPSRG